MQIRYYKEYSRYLDRFMEFKVYGHAGRPIIIFPCQSGRFYDWEDRNMCNLAAPWIDSGKLQIFTADSIDPESWDNHGPERPRIEMQERWYNYICEELTPRLLEINREQGGEDHTGKILVGGASMGGGHAVNFFLRRPDLYNGTIALSGLYSSIPTWSCSIKPISSLCAAARVPGRVTCWPPRWNCRASWKARASTPSWTFGAMMSPMIGSGGRSSGPTSCR